MYTTSKMIQNRFGKTATIQTRPSGKSKNRWKAELIFDVEEFGLEGLIRTGEFLTEQESIDALNKKILHVMGDR